LLIIGFGHRARQGKNTAAAAVQECFPLDTNVGMASFADALRMEVRKASAKMGGAYYLVQDFKAAGLMPDWVQAEPSGKQRLILQWWGTDYRRKQDPDYWVKKLMAKLDAWQPDAVLITDVRFPNEADAIKAAGGVLVKVVRTSEPDFVVNEHPSESALDAYTGWDYTLRAADVPELKQKARALYAEIVRSR
jgi:LmbE family N-acetylglucosaminyl deacetylase